MNTNLALIGYTCDQGASIAGTAFGPDIYRARGLETRLKQLGLSVEDYGNIESSNELSLEQSDTCLISSDEKLCQHLENVFLSCKSLYMKTTLALSNNKLPIVLGGDHSLSIGSTSAVSNYYRNCAENIGLIWIDAHADFNTPMSSPSKRIFGMTTAVLAGHIPGLLSSLQSQCPRVHERNIAYIGLRDLDPLEKLRLNNSKCCVATIQDIDLYGIGHVVSKALNAALDKTIGFVVSFDIDVCDSSLMPGTGTPCRGGLTFRETHLALELLHASNKMLAFEIAELNPILDSSFQTTEIAISFIESAVGKTIL